MILQGRHLFEKRFSSPHPIFQKLSDGIAFIVADKNNSNFIFSISTIKKGRCAPFGLQQPFLSATVSVEHIAQLLEEIHTTL